MLFSAERGDGTVVYYWDRKIVVYFRIYSRFFFSGVTGKPKSLSQDSRLPFGDENPFPPPPPKEIYYRIS
jgi:hypothetical protein